MKKSIKIDYSFNLQDKINWYKMLIARSGYPDMIVEYKNRLSKLEAEQKRRS